MYDVIIIGGGPGGSTAGTLLARGGKKVLILEREKFPRFHIGESLIPYGNDVFRELGVWEKMESAGYIPKLGAEFVLGNGRAKIEVLFARYLLQQYGQTFQVERAKFDQMLLENAQEAGCEVWQEAKVTSATEEPGQMTLTCEHGGEQKTLTAKWVVDASGRDAFLGKQFRLEKTDLGLAKKFATFAHFTGVVRNPAPAEGHITIVRLDFGWFWIIPLDAEKTSVGLVQTLEHFKKTGMTPQECFEHVVATTTEPSRRLANATRVSDYHFAGDYTYRHLRNAGDRWVLVGDAAGFVDPIFSSGVMMSVRSGRLAARAILAAQGGPISKREQEAYTKAVGRMCHTFVEMIKMFYDNRSFEVFMTPKPPGGMEWAVNNLVAGNTDMNWRLKLQVWLFYRVCWLQKRFQLSPRLDLSDPRAKKQPEPVA